MPNSFKEINNINLKKLEIALIPYKEFKAEKKQFKMEDSMSFTHYT